MSTLDEFVEGLDEFYPGSKRKRREVSGEPKTRASLTTEEEWGRPVTKLIKGRQVDLWPVSGLAHALGKSIYSVRLWERMGYIPKAPFRLRVESTEGPESAGRRYYSRELIQAAVEEFDKRGLLNKVYIKWTEQNDLIVALEERWRQVIEEI